MHTNLDLRPGASRQHQPLSPVAAAAAPDSPAVLEAANGAALPNLVVLHGAPLVDTSSLFWMLRSATDAVLAFAYLALWWHQSGRPALGDGEAGQLRETLERVAEACLRGGLHEGCRELGRIPPEGAWWSFGPFDPGQTDVPLSRLSGIDTVLTNAALAQEDAEERYQGVLADLRRLGELEPAVFATVARHLSDEARADLARPPFAEAHDTPEARVDDEPTVAFSPVPSVPPAA